MHHQTRGSSLPSCVSRDFSLQEDVLFSCKISHSILTYLDRQGSDLGDLFEVCEYPAEFLRNPLHWLEAGKMEDLLAFFARDYNRFSRDGQLIQEAGHNCRDLRSWGVLDSVLRMVQSPRDIFAQPDRFISYFVSPAPPVGNILRDADCIFFELPIAASQYPYVTEYLRAALEGLPTYVDKPMASVAWNEIRVSVNWVEKQESLFTDDQTRETHLNPEILKGIIHSLEATQRELEETKRLLADREQALATATAAVNALGVSATKAQPQAETILPPSEFDMTKQAISEERWQGLARALRAEISAPAQEALKHIYRLNDYMARAQQLVTLLVGQGRMTAQVQEAMRRVDWKFTQSEAPLAVKQAANSVRKIEDVIKDVALLGDDNDLEGAGLERKVSADINVVVDKAVRTVEAEFTGRARIDKHLLMDRDVPLHPKPMERALTNLIKNAVQSISGDGTVRIVTRPNGTRAEIEIVDSGVGMNEATRRRAIEPLFTTQRPGTAAGLGLSLAQSIVNCHDGSLTLASRPGHGTTVLVSLPMIISDHK